MSAAVAAGAYLHHLALTSADPARLAEFYGRVMQMPATRADNDQWVCRGPWRDLLIVRGRDNALGFAAFACRDEEGLALLRSHIEAHRTSIEPSPSPLFDERAFAVRDPEGNVLVFGLAAERPEEAGRALRGPLQHVTVNSTDMAAMEKFYAGNLGFALSDRVRDESGRVTTVFVRSTHEHHTVGMFLKDKAGLDHHSYEAGEVGHDSRLGRSPRNDAYSDRLGPRAAWARQQPFHLHQGPRRQHDRDLGGDGICARQAGEGMEARTLYVEHVGSGDHAHLITMTGRAAQRLPTSAEKVLGVLSLFTAERPIWSPERAAKRMNVSLATGYRYFNALVGCGILEKLQRNQYVLGPAIVELDRQIRTADPVLKLAQPVMARLVRRMREPAAVLLCRYYRQKVMCIHQETNQTGEPVSSYERGARRPMFRGATSKVILAHLSPRMVANLWRDHRREIGAAGMGINSMTSRRRCASSGANPSM